MVRYAVLERVAEAVLTDEAVEAMLDRAETIELPRRIAERVLADGIAERTVERILAGPELERVVAAALASPGTERLMVRVMESRLLDETVDRLLDSEELWLLVQEIADSPAVTDAIGRQGIGFADQVAGGVRARSRRADAWLERAARRALRRKPLGELPPGPPLDPA